MNLLQSTLIEIHKLSLNTGQIPDVPKNPRFIRDERFKKLVKSLEDNPEMLPARELLVYNYDGELIVIGGNMRLRAAKELGYKEIPCKILEDLTPEQIRAIVIKDNVSFGSDDWESLANEWDSIELEEWGMGIFKMPDISLDDIPEDIVTNNNQYKDTDDYAIDYLNSDIKKFEIYINKNDYDKIVEKLNEVKKNENLETNSDAIIHLILNYK